MQRRRSGEEEAELCAPTELEAPVGLGALVGLGVASKNKYKNDS